MKRLCSVGYTDVPSTWEQSKVFFGRILQVLHVLAAFGLCVLRDSASTRSISRLCTANTAILPYSQYFLGSILWNTAILQVFWGSILWNTGGCTALPTEPLSQHLLSGSVGRAI